jgi:hypothetical protein
MWHSWMTKWCCEKFVYEQFVSPNLSTNTSCLPISYHFTNVPFSHPSVVLITNSIVTEKKNGFSGINIELEKGVKGYVHGLTAGTDHNHDECQEVCVSDHLPNRHILNQKDDTFSLFAQWEEEDVYCNRWGTARTKLPTFLCCSMYCLFCVVLCIVCV